MFLLRWANVIILAWTPLPDNSSVMITGCVRSLCFLFDRQLLCFGVSTYINSFLEGLLRPSIVNLLFLVSFLCVVPPYEQRSLNVTTEEVDPGNLEIIHCNSSECCHD